MPRTVSKQRRTGRRSPAVYGTIKEAREKKRTMATQATAIFQKHITEKRDMSSEEKENFDKLTSDVSELSDRITALEDMGDEDEDEEDDDEREDEDDPKKKEDEDEDEDDDKGDRNRRPDGEQRNDRRTREQREEDERRDRRQRREGRNADTRNNPTRRTSERAAKVPELRRYHGESEEHFKHRQRRNSVEYTNMVCDYLQYGTAGLMMSDKRALQADIDIAGGYLVLPEQVSQKILKKVDNVLWLLQLATVATLANAQSLGEPTLETNIDDGDWTTEIAQISADTGMTMGKRALTPTPIRKRILVSERWLRLAFNAAFQSADDQNGQGGSPENIVINRLAYTIKNTWEKNFFLGNGSGKPLGMFTASSRGISTARDFLTGSATTFTYAGLLAAKWALKTQYHKSAGWTFSRKAMELIMGLVDSNGRPLLNIATLPDVPDQLLQFPTRVSEHTPNTFTTGQYVGMLGDYSFIHVAVSQELTVKQAQELYAETGQVGFFISAEADAMPVLEEAFVRLKTN
jgi:HK97 family phage major capsid protein